MIGCIARLIDCMVRYGLVEDFVGVDVALGVGCFCHCFYQYFSVC